MPIKLDDPTEKLLNDGKVSKQDVYDMVKEYRTKHASDSTKINFIHFNMREILELFINNEIMNPSPYSQTQLKGFEKFGFKIYLGNHHKDSNCPAGTLDPGTGHSRYYKKDNAIICTTFKDETNPKKWVDNLKDRISFITFTGAGELKEVGQGQDRGTVCEPDCANMQGPDGYVQTDIFP